jgi:hypothetical protein
MRAFLKTLFDDARIIAYVIVVMIAEVLLIANGHLASAAAVVPSLILAMFAWLAKREWV